MLGKSFNWFSNLRLAFSFLTIIPLAVTNKEERISLSQAMAYFPLVGFFIAVISLFIVGIFSHYFSPRLLSLFLVLLPIIISGGLHIDGLADSFDAFFQGKDKHDILHVMKDSRIGVWGTLSVVFLLLMKWECLVMLPQQNAGFILAIGLSRWAHGFICFLLPYARTEKGLGQEVAGAVSEVQIFLSTVFVLIVSLFLGITGIVAVLLSGIFIYLLSKFYKKRIGGITGDVIGATGELTEVFVYLVLIVNSN